MIGNFTLNVCGVPLSFHYDTEPGDQEFDFIVSMGDPIVIGSSVKSESVRLFDSFPLTDVVYSRVLEQTGLKPESIGFNVK